MLCVVCDWMLKEMKTELKKATGRLAKQTIKVLLRFFYSTVGYIVLHWYLLGVPEMILLKFGCLRPNRVFGSKNFIRFVILPLSPTVPLNSTNKLCLLSMPSPNEILPRNFNEMLIFFFRIGVPRTFSRFQITKRPSFIQWAYCKWSFEDMTSLLCTHGDILASCLGEVEKKIRERKFNMLALTRKYRRGSGWCY